MSLTGLSSLKAFMVLGTLSMRRAYEYL